MILALRISRLGVRLAALAVAVSFSNATAAEPAAAPPRFKAFENAAGVYWRTSDGRPLYWNDDDVKAGAVKCNAGCLKNWTPVDAQDADEAADDWTFVTRGDNVRQWMYQGKPLYVAANSASLGGKFGAAASAKWHPLFEPIALPAAFRMQTTLLGRILADHKGRTVYVNRAARGPSAGGGWIPLEAPWLARAQGDWGIRALADGGLQWTYKGQPLFRYENDNDPQDLYGQNLEGSWTAVILEPAPALPRWMTIQRADLGWVYADARGMTLYAPARPETIKVAQTCPEDCMNTYWRPVLAAKDEVPTGRWTIIQNETGVRQWAYEGRPAYTHLRDTKPGEMRGNSFAVGYNIGDGFRIIPVDAAVPASGN